MRIPSWAAFLLAAASVGGCIVDKSISSSIGTTVKRGVGTKIVFADYAIFNWSRACVFGPYTPDETVESVTGIHGAATKAFDIRSNDGIDVLMFLGDDRVVHSVRHRRDQGDFGPEVVGKCYPRAEAVFVVRTPPPGSWGNIGPS